MDIFAEVVQIGAREGADLVLIETIRRIRDELHGTSILGVSNISFGLPARELVNSYFFAMALQNGLSCAIINPNNQAMMQAYRSFCALTAQDENFMDFIGAYQNYKTPEKRVSEAVDNCRARVLDALGISAGDLKFSGSPLGNGPKSQANASASTQSSNGTSSAGGSSEGKAGKTRLMEAIERGMAGPAAEATKEALRSRDALDIINQDLVPALDTVGQGFEKGTIFLPQLREKKPDCRIAVGGAVMTQDYADKIGADCYGSDAMATVRYADELCEKGLL